MKPARVLLIGLVVGAVAFATWPAATLATAPAPLHFELRTSVPHADSTVAPTDRIQLWFTQEPQEGTTQIRVMQGDERVPTGDAIRDPEDAMSYFVQHDMPLESGEYRVMWRSMAPDGHVVDGQFEFRVVEAGGAN